MRLFGLAVIVGVLAASASGVSALLLEEPCALNELSGQGEDGDACPPTCVTCGCCAMAVEPVDFADSDAPDTTETSPTQVRPRLPRIDPLDILHVPRLRRA